MVDGWNLNRTDVVACNTIRYILGLPQNNLFDTEYLVWKRIPRHAIIQKWSWDTIRSSLGKLFPALGNLTSLPPPQKRALHELRFLLCSPDDPNIETLVSHLVSDLMLLPQNLTTKQVAMMILGWSRGMSETRVFDRLEANLRHLIPDKVKELDFRLYARTCQWNIYHQWYFTEDLGQNLDHLIDQVRVARNFNLPAYEDWLSERNIAEERECAAMPGADLDEPSLLSILKCNGLEVAALTFRRPPLKINPTRRKTESLGVYTIRVD